LDNLVVGRPPPHRTGGAEARQGAVDQPGVERLEPSGTESEAVEHTGPEVLQQHVRGLDEPAEHLRAVLVLQVDSDRPLAGVLGEERDAEAPGAELGIGAELPRQVTRARQLHLHDVGAEQRQLVTGERPGKHVGQVQDPDPGE
jgi:hypothetical protein